MFGFFDTKRNGQPDKMIEYKSLLNTKKVTYLKLCETIENACVALKAVREDMEHSIMTYNSKHLNFFGEAIAEDSLEEASIDCSQDVERDTITQELITQMQRIQEEEITSHYKSISEIKERIKAWEEDITIIESLTEQLCNLHLGSAWQLEQHSIELESHPQYHEKQTAHANLLLQQPESEEKRELLLGSC